MLAVKSPKGKAFKIFHGMLGLVCSCFGRFFAKEVTKRSLRRLALELIQLLAAPTTLCPRLFLIKMGGRLPFQVYLSIYRCSKGYKNSIQRAISRRYFAKKKNKVKIMMVYHPYCQGVKNPGEVDSILQEYIRVTIVSF